MVTPSPKTVWWSMNKYVVNSHQPKTLYKKLRSLSQNKTDKKLLLRDADTRKPRSLSSQNHIQFNKYS
jgi:hypothetical protein